jgi:hypothetical protein
MHASRNWVLGAALSGLCLAVGCSSSDKVAVSDGATIAELARVGGQQPPFNAWRKIYSVESGGARVEKKHVGYLNHKTSEEDREGKFFVLDLKHDVRGFLLPEGKAFLYNPQWPTDTFRDLGNTGFQSGVKRILEVPGEVQFGALDSSSTAPAPAAPSE